MNTKDRALNWETSLCELKYGVRERLH